jgi:hypothetical protein
MTTTIAPSAPTQSSVGRLARIGTVGGVLWTSSSGVWAASQMEDQPFGSLSFIGIEIASMSVGGGEVASGHVVLLVGFLVTVVGGVVTGITALRRLPGALPRVAGWLLVLALPLGAGVGALGSTLAPGNDAVFWAVLTLPTGIAWVLLGRSLATRPPAVDAR